MRTAFSASKSCIKPDRSGLRHSFAACPLPLPSPRRSSTLAVLTTWRSLFQTLVNSSFRWPWLLELRYLNRFREEHRLLSRHSGRSGQRCPGTALLVANLICVLNIEGITGAWCLHCLREPWKHQDRGLRNHVYITMPSSSPRDPSHVSYVLSVLYTASTPAGSDKPHRQVPGQQQRGRNAPHLHRGNT